MVARFNRLLALLFFGCSAKTLLLVESSERDAMNCENFSRFDFSLLYEGFPFHMTDGVAREMGEREEKWGEK